MSLRDRIEQAVKENTDRARLAQELSMEYTPSAGQMTNFLGMLAPGAGVADAAGEYPALPSYDQPVTEAFSNLPYPSMSENIANQNIFDASMQGLGVAGDALYTVPVLGAALGPTAGTVLKGIGALGTVAKAASKGEGIKALDKTGGLQKDMVFLHNTSPDKLALYDNIGGLPSPSIAVTKADTPHGGFGNITLIGKPQKFDPAVDSRNKVYSADAYTPRGPKPIRLAKPGAAEQLAKDYADIKTTYRDTSENLEQGTHALRNLQKDNLYYPENRMIDLENFFFTGIAKRKYAKEKGLPDRVFNEYDDFIDYGQLKEFRKWVTAEKDKYLSQDAVFQYFDDVEETMKTVPYNTENVVANMISDTQRGGEKTFGTSDNYLRALTSKTYPDLPSIKADKSRIRPSDSSELDLAYDTSLFDDIGDVLQTEKIIGPDDFYEIDELLDFVKTELVYGEKLERAVNGAVKKLVDDSNLKYIDGPSINAKILKVFEDNANLPVSYFEAKPTRAVDFDEFAGAIVPANTPQSTINLLEKRGLKVVRESEASSKGDLIKENFGKELFSVVPIAAAASATAMMESENKGIDAL